MRRPLGLILLVCIAGVVVLVMIHAKVAAYHEANKGNPPAP
jgi:hypothetical protein